MHAVLKQLQARGVIVVERAGHDRAFVMGNGHQIPPTKRPGESLRWGSKLCLTFRIRVIAGIGPHTSKRAFTGAGASSSTAEPPSAAHTPRTSARRRATSAGSASAAIAAYSTPVPADPRTLACTA